MVEEKNSLLFECKYVTELGPNVSQETPGEGSDHWQTFLIQMRKNKVVQTVERI